MTGSAENLIAGRIGVNPFQISNEPISLADLERANVQKEISINSILKYPGISGLDNSMQFSNGYYNYQRSKESVEAFFCAVAEELGKYSHTSPEAKKIYELFLENPRISSQYPGILPEHLDRLMYRAACIDLDYKEWGQPGFALRPEQCLLPATIKTILAL